MKTKRTRAKGAVWMAAVGATTTMSCTEPFVCSYQPDALGDSNADMQPSDLPTATAAFACRAVDQFGLPVPGVTVTIGSKSTTTDAQGNFSLSGVLVTESLITLDGSALSVPDPDGESPPRSYGKIAERLRLSAGITNARDRPFVVPLGNTPDDISGALDQNNVVRNIEGDLYIYSDGDACGEGYVTLRVPVGTKINFPPGAPKRIAITKIAGDLAPGELSRVGTPMLLMLQPSGLTFSRPVELILPTYSSVPNGQIQEIISLDYGTGEYVVSNKSQQLGCELAPDSDTGITSFSFHTARCPPLDVSGQVRDDNGQPVAGARVVARAHRGLDRSALYDIPGATAVTGSDGRYRIEGVRACAVDMMARVDLGNGRVIQSGGAEIDGNGPRNQDLELPPTSDQRQRLDLRAKVAVAVNARREGIPVRLQGADGNVLCGQTNSQGEVLFRDVQAVPGELRVTSGAVGVNVTNLPTQAPGEAACGIVNALEVSLNCAQAGVSGSGSGSGCDIFGDCESFCFIGCEVSDRGNDPR